MNLKKIYPWIVCGVGILLYFCTCGMTTVGFSAYLPYLKDSLDLSSTETSVITTIRCLSSMIAMMFSDTYYKKFSLRKGMFIACALLPIAYIIFGNANSVLWCYFAAVILGISYAFGTMIPLALLIRQWFISFQATALSITACGSGISTAIMPPIIAVLLDAFGLKWAFYASAIASFIVAIILVLVIRDNPSQLQMQPYYKEGSKDNSKKADAKKKLHNHDLSKKEAAFFIFAILMVGCSGTPYTHHLSLHYTTVGYTAMQAAAALSFYGIVLTCSKVLFGICSDRFGTYRVNYMFFGAWIGASFITSLLTGSMGLLYLTALLNGIGIPLGTIGVTVWSGDLSSEEQYAKRLKFSQTVFQLGSLVGTVIPGIIADVTGSYAPTYFVFAVMLVTEMMIIQALYRRYMKKA